MKIPSFNSKVRRPSLRSRMVMLFTSVAAGITVLLYFSELHNDREELLHNVRSLVFERTVIASQIIVESLHTGDRSGLMNGISVLTRRNDIRAILVCTAAGDTVYRFGNLSGIVPLRSAADHGGEEELDAIAVRVPVLLNGTMVGTLTTEYSLHRERALLDAMHRATLLFCCILFVTGVIVILVMTRFLLQPVDAMTAALQNSGANRLLLVPKTGLEDLDRLGVAFNEIVETLGTVQKELQSVNRTLEERVHSRTIELQQEIEQHLHTEGALRESEERYRTLVQMSPDGMIIYSGGRFFPMNEAAQRMFGVPSDVAHSGWVMTDHVPAEEREEFQLQVSALLVGPLRTLQSEQTFFTSSGESFVADITGRRMTFQGSIAVHLMVRDVSSRIRDERLRIDLEQQLLHAQKKEIIGTLSSGIAHDMLNILGIVGTAVNRLLFLRSVDERVIAETADQITKATDRGRALVKQLLSFAKKTALNFESVHVNAIAQEITSVIQRTFPPAVIVETSLQNDLPVVRADNNQIHQALLNLCLNARDAVQGKGRIVIATSVVEDLPPGSGDTLHARHVCLSVEDDGVGMPPEVMKRIYEPFFTTKSDEAGSGLGLSMVKGIVDNHRGVIDVLSEPGKGTIFRIFLPV